MMLEIGIFYRYIMETNTIMDWVLGILALSILVGGMLMLFSGVRGMGNK
jgi:hypothetical protein